MLIITVVHSALVITIIMVVESMRADVSVREGRLESRNHYQHSLIMLEISAVFINHLKHFKCYLSAKSLRRHYVNRVLDVAERVHDVQSSLSTNPRKKKKMM